MKRPGVLARLAGVPLVAVLLFAVYGVVIVGWYQEAAPWWLALLGLDPTVVSPAAILEATY